MTPKDPKSKRDFPESVTEKLSKGQKFETGTGGIIKFDKVKRAREPDGRTTYVATFEVVEEDEAGFVFGASYSTTEYLALCKIEDGSLTPAS